MSDTSASAASIFFLLRFISASLIFAARACSGELALLARVSSNLKLSVKFSLGEVKIRQCHLIGKDISSGVDAGNKFLPRRRRAFDRVQKAYEVEFRLRILRICRRDRPQFLFGIVLPMLIDIEFDQLLAKCNFLRIKLGQFPKQRFDLRQITQLLEYLDLEKLDPEVVHVLRRSRCREFVAHLLRHHSPDDRQQEPSLHLHCRDRS